MELVHADPADYRCSACGYGAVRESPPESCPMCGGDCWRPLEPRAGRPRPWARRRTGSGSAFAFSAAEQSAERRSTFTYWVGNSEGFRVESPEGRIGIVEDVRRSLDTGHANALVIRCGRLAHRIVIAPVGEVASVIPRQATLILRASPQLLDQPEPPHERPELRLVHGATPRSPG